MGSAVSAEIYIHATREQVASALVPGPVAGDLLLGLDETWYVVGWTRSLHAWRHDARWLRGRATGTATIDLMDAGAERTLVVVTLTTRSWSVRRVGTGDAVSIARRLRAVAEQTASVPRLPHMDGLAADRQADGALSAVGYSGA